MNQISDAKSAPALALRDPTLLRQRCYVDGAWADADDRATITVRNPATSVPVGMVPRMGAAETRKAIEAANERCPNGGLVPARNAPRSCANGPI